MWFFLLARIAWGVSWSFLNLGMYFSVLSYTEKSQRGQWMGRTKAISRVGTIVAVVIGGYLTDRLGFRLVVLILGSLAMIGAWIAYRTTCKARHLADAGVEPAVHLGGLPVQPIGGESEVTATGTMSVNLVYGMSFMFGFVMHGVVVGTLALLVTQRYGEVVGLFGMTLGVATVSGFLLGARWVIEMLFSPAGGRLGDRYGAVRIVPIAAVIQAFMLALLSFVYNPHGLVLIGCLIFLSGVVTSVSLDAVAGNLALQRSSASQVMSRYVTAQDFGAAVGPLVGYLVGIGVGLDGFYLAAAVAMTFMAVAFSWSRSKSFVG